MPGDLSRRPASLVPVFPAPRHPIAPNAKPDGADDPAGRQRNRRVEVVLDSCKQGG